jgi:DNA-directed RNA polymerase subunit RPC12/RpoP
LGLVKGYIDPKKREFIAEGYVPHVHSRPSASRTSSKPITQIPIPVKPLEGQGKPESPSELLSIKCPYCKNSYEVEKQAEHLLKKCPHCGMPRMLDI